MSSVYMHSINMFDLNMETIAEFMVMHDTANNQHWIKVIPFYGVYKTYERDVTDPIVSQIFPGGTMLMETFLGYIGNCANAGSKMPYPYTMATPEVQLVLTTGISLEKVHHLTGWDLDKITEFYKDYVVFG